MHFSKLAAALVEEKLCHGKKKASKDTYSVRVHMSTGSLAEGFVKTV